MLTGILKSSDIFSHSIFCNLEDLCKFIPSSHYLFSHENSRAKLRVLPRSPSQLTDEPTNTAAEQEKTMEKREVRRK
jgi:hypothetical protein